ncbi:hybrid sensor histidine kinase/response regulator transcription factor [Tellurirhabdus bombi]|uniref:hybrid sensor histidine kinase/response regulator transcription factor n=1 Tax=Tellurirhabdus bombi TaxID=2907205 RepID=UPI001F324514|nr:two-component regulator propeller domain-containing protein [Tellurirhabdus bombi]
MAQRYTRILLILSVLMLECLPERAFSQPITQTFSHLTVEEGLSQSSVYAITQDKADFMWFGTRDGLNRYDAGKVVVYRKQSKQPNSLSSNAINSLLTDRQGRLWVGTNGGLNFYQPKQDNFQRIVSDSTNTQSLSNSQVTTLLQDLDGSLWVGTRDGLNRSKKPTSFQFERFLATSDAQTALANTYIRALFQDRQGTLWVGTSAGLSRLTRTKAGRYQIANFYLEAKDSVYRDNANWVNTIAEDAAGRLWLGTEKKGIALFDKTKGKVVSWNAVQGLDLSTQTIRNIEPGEQGRFWVGTISGLYIIAQDGRYFQKLTNNPAKVGSLNDNSIRAIYRDRNGSFWVGTYYGGVNFYSSLAKPFGAFQLVDREGGIPFKTAGPMLPSQQGQLWIGTDDRGLLLTNRNRTILRHYTHTPKNKQSISNDKIKCLLADGQKGLWVGTIKGLNYLDFRTNSFTRYFNDPGDANSLPDDRIYDLKYDAEGNLWIATYRGGLCRFEPKTGLFERLIAQPANPEALQTNAITSLLIDSRQQFWVGTTQGLYQKIKGKNAFIRLKHKSDDSTSLSGNYIACLFEDQQQRLWVGTRDNGLNRLEPGSRTFRRFSVQHGLPGNTIAGIREDGRGRIWISTENGLSRFDPKQGRFSNFDKHDGLVCKEFTTNSAYRDERGYLYFGGYNGIVIFHPDSIRSNNHIPRLAFTGLKLFNQPVSLADSTQTILEKSIQHTPSLTFNHQQNVFSVEFAVLNFINSPKNRYAYQLVGFDKDWNYVDEPVATYMNLEPGDYTLRIKGANNDGVWNPQPLEVAITILPPLWKSTWAYALYVTVFLGLLYMWSRFNRVRLQLAHDLQLEHLEKERQQELHQTKLNFFTNIAHEIRTPLTLVISPIEVLSSQYPADSLIQKQLSVMKLSTNRLLRLLNQLLDFQKHETGNVRLHRQEHDLVTFLRSITDSFQEYARSRQVTLRYESEKAAVSVWFDAGEMEKVFYNLLLNAFKFTPAGGEIAVRIAFPEGTDADENQVCIFIEDNGVGISADDLHRIFHRFYQADHPGTHNSGFGIGLALSKSIIDLHQGTIGVESREASAGQHGHTQFMIKLPLAVASEATNIKAKGEEITAFLAPAEPIVVDFVQEEVSTNHSVEKPLILIVEDQEDIRAYLKEMLQETYQVVEAANGALAWEQATQSLPDLVISDVAMPVMDGVELTRRLKTDARTAHIPVILLTARTAVEHQLAGLKTGADEYLTKPFHGQLLMTRIQNLLQLREKLKAKYHRIVTLQPQNQEIDHPDDKFLNRLMTIMESNLSNADFNVASLVTEMGMSRPVLFRKVKMLTGLSVIDLLRTTRLKKAEMLLKQRKMSVSEVAFTVGFNDPKYFSKSFRSQFGQTPTEYLTNLN